jgi:hypothetical protein
MSIHLTPTEDLAIETLLARHRLGETLWTFEARHRKTLEALADKGLVTVVHGTVEKSVRASLTEHAIDSFLSADYVPPILRTECPVWYAGERSNGFRLDCEKKRHHVGKHRVHLAYSQSDVKWTTAEAEASQAALAARFGG